MREKGGTKTIISRLDRVDWRSLEGLHLSLHFVFELFK
jgi:hypothetical protein